MWRHNKSNQLYASRLHKVKGLKEIVKITKRKSNKADELLMIEFVWHSLSDYSQLSKHQLNTDLDFKDLMSSD